MTFANLYRSGKIFPNEIDEFIDKWHNDNVSKLELHEYLGMTWNEYAEWIENPKALEEILNRNEG